MNREEKGVYDLLVQKHSSIVFEPLGVKKFPDFLIDDKIAVEVTRLTQGHESETIPLMELLEEELSQYKYEGESFLVSVAVMGRPIGKSKEIKNSLREIITHFESADFNLPVSFNLSEFVEINFLKKSISTTTKYKLQPLPFDIARVHFVEGTNVDHINNCIVLKEEKLNEVQSKFKEFQLYLVDNIHSIDGANLNEVKRSVNKLSWNKVIVLDSMCKRILLQV